MINFGLSEFLIVGSILVGGVGLYLAHHFIAGPSHKKKEEKSNQQLYTPHLRGVRQRKPLKGLLLNPTDESSDVFGRFESGVELSENEVHETAAQLLQATKSDDDLLASAEPHRVTPELTQSTEKATTLTTATELPIQPAAEEEESFRATFERKAAIALQSTWRGFFFRLKLFRKKTQKTRELLETEQSYVSWLQVIMEVFISTFHQHNALSSEDEKMIFSDVVVIFNYNSAFLDALTRCMATWSYHQQTLGPLFQNLAPFLITYSSYTANFPAACERIKVLAQKKSAFKKILEGCERDPRCKRLGLVEILIMPVQRACRYLLFLEDLIKATPLAHPDHKALTTALEKIAKITAKINANKAHAESIERVVLCSQTLRGLDQVGEEELVQPHRRHLRQGPLAQFQNVPSARRSSWQLVKKMVILFNDCLLVARIETQNKKEVYMVETRRYLATVTVAATARGVPDTHLSCAFSIVGPSPADTFSLIATTVEERDEWVSILAAAIENAVQTLAQTVAPEVRRVMGQAGGTAPLTADAVGSLSTTSTTSTAPLTSTAQDRVVRSRPKSSHRHVSEMFES
eukprot:GCRY01002976.1.p1 GENE.GCRY01002976.1~~GCRY01002976.1.p1  ORF type:complete len:576 (+),score=132.78 GCRY01002976.1:214-1941(+)